jgi:hypothetical protein
LIETTPVGRCSVATSCSGFIWSEHDGMDPEVQLVHEVVREQVLRQAGVAVDDETHERGSAVTPSRETRHPTEIFRMCIRRCG